MIEYLVLCWVMGKMVPIGIMGLVIFLTIVELAVLHLAHYDIWTPIRTPIGKAFPYLSALMPVSLILMFVFGWLASFILYGFTGKRLDLRLYYPRSDGWKFIY